MVDELMQGEPYTLPSNRLNSKAAGLHLVLPGLGFFGDIGHEAAVDEGLEPAAAPGMEDVGKSAPETVLSLVL
jgi:hypothetical protein